MAEQDTVIVDAHNKFKSFDIWKSAREIPADLMILTDWNCNEMGDTEFSALIDDVEENQFDEPCQVVPIVQGPNAGKYLVVGGEHRYKVCVALEHDTVPCVLKEHLDPGDRELLMEYSVRRNNIRGRVNSQKYAEIEAAICRKKGLKAEMARERMLVRGESLKKLRKTGSVRENEPEKLGPATDGERSKKKTRQDRAKLLEDLKAIEQEVLLESGDSVDHGYLYFGQGGKNHLVVEESKKLYAAVKDMVQVCKNDSARIDEWLFEAISAKLNQEKG